MITELQACFLVVVCFAGGIFVGWLWGFCQGHDKAMAAWRRSHDEWITGITGSPSTWREKQ